MYSLFIHIPKNAGLTIRRSPLLQNRIILAGPAAHKSREYTQAVLDKMNKLGDHHGFEHARWRDVHPTIRDRHNAFAVIRNPWDRVVSRYYFAKKVIEVEKKVDPSYADTSSFEASLKSVISGVVKSICGIERYEVGFLLMIMSLMILAGYAVILLDSKILMTTSANILN